MRVPRFYLAASRLLLLPLLSSTAPLLAAQSTSPEELVSQGLDWLASQQHRLGHWNAQGRYPAAMTALSGIALMCEGSTPTQGKYAPQLRRAVDYLIRQARPNGLIGDPLRDDRYTYGHGFSMLFLSQVLGEEEDLQRRDELIRVLSKAVEFTGAAQTAAGGWGYVSATEKAGFDEGSTTITQVQGLRGCRNAGIRVPKVVIDKAVEYIHNCTQKDGGVQYSSKGGGGRAPITAAAIACLYNAGEYDDQYVPRMKLYCRRHLEVGNQSNYSHWHYAHFYYSQVKYREGGEAWDEYKKAIAAKLMREASPANTPEGPGVYWEQGYISNVYITALNLIILQQDKAMLPIYQR
ncbi:MAG: terpene cyclase/mutase family protein [Planctomycetales bacterium]|nr:terpene cyclase/mutase family protein [Planctomycetales bacterium]